MYVAGTLITKFQEINDNARVAYILDILAALPAASGLPMRF